MVSCDSGAAFGNPERSILSRAPHPPTHQMRQSCVRAGVVTSTTKQFVRLSLSLFSKKDAKYFEKHEVRFGLAVRPEQYPGGEADVVEACNGSGVLVEEVVAAVHKTGDSVRLYSTRLSRIFFLAFQSGLAVRL